MTIKRFLTQLHRRNIILSITGWIHLLFLAGAAVGNLIDSRQILGVNPRIKPAKFAISFATFLWTMGWLTAPIAMW